MMVTSGRVVSKNLKYVTRSGLLCVGGFITCRSICEEHYNLSI